MPIPLLRKLEEDFQRWVLLIAGVQDVKGTWSTHQDSPARLVQISEPSTGQEAFLDGGIAANRETSRQFVAGGLDSLEELVARLRQRQLQSRVFSRG